ncbi:hypothetical protein E6L38_09170 [Bifidobacterium longum subsp. infantis]|uniref:Uncharacterized protein n=1 Tax=Bifidobacterium longum subsp. infantis TaxID=1682 RepID=A0A4S5BD65_BIFLI|nr:hypothetical protein E6L38_09170 [Bifidobacterium longum subsp. infantis]
MSERPVVGSDVEPNYWPLACRIKVTPMLFYVSGMFIMITVILSLTDSIEYGQEDRKSEGPEPAVCRLSARSVHQLVSAGIRYGPWPCATCQRR